MICLKYFYQIQKTNIIVIGL